MGMTQDNIDNIEEDYMYLSVSMRENIKRLVKYLAEKSIIKAEEEEDIMDEASDTLKSQTLLDYILKLDDNAFNDFYDGALHSHMWTAADILKPELGPHKPKEEDIEEFLPDKWPTESHFEEMKHPANMKLKKVGTKHSRMMGHYEECSKPHSTIYDMRQKVRGRVLIINNEFLNHETFPPKKGARYDRPGLDQMFSRLGFEIDVENNKTKNQMWDIMHREIKRDHKQYNCFVLAILTYGYENKNVFGADGNVVGGEATNFISVEKIKEHFSKAGDLVNKPKVFLIDAPPSKKTDRYMASASIKPPKIPEIGRMQIGASCQPDIPNDGMLPADFGIGPKLSSLLSIGGNSGGLLSEEKDRFSASMKTPKINIGIDTGKRQKGASCQSDTAYDGILSPDFGISSKLSSLLSIGADSGGLLSEEKDRYMASASIKPPKIPEIGRRHIGASPMTSSLRGISHDAIFSPAIKRPHIDIARDFSPWTVTDGDDDPFRIDSSAPSRSDVFEASAYSGATLKNKDEPVGSWFIQAFIFIVTNYAYQMDLQTIIEQVNRLVHSQVDTTHSNFRVSGESEQTSQQVCSPSSTLNKKLYFFPGLPIDP